MVTIYQLTLLVNGKPVQYNMTADESLEVKHKIDNKTADKIRLSLMGLADTMFKEN